MAYQHQHSMSATFVPGMDDFYQPPAAPELVAPKPNRYGSSSKEDAGHRTSSWVSETEC